MNKPRRSTGVRQVILGFAAVIGLQGCAAHTPYRFVEWHGGYAVAADGGWGIEDRIIDEFTQGEDGSFPKEQPVAQERFNCRQSAVEAFYNEFDAGSGRLPPGHPLKDVLVQAPLAIVLLPLAIPFALLHDLPTFQPSERERQIEEERWQAKLRAKADLWGTIAKDCPAQPLPEKQGE